MESLASVATVAVPLVALHVVVAAYLYRVALSGDGRTLDRETKTEERSRDPLDRPVGRTDGTMPCPTCGAPNDPSYRFCRHCVADLTAKRRTSTGVAAGRLGS